MSKGKKVYVVISGEIDGPADGVTTVGSVFKSREDALDFRNEEYKQCNDIDEEDVDMGPDLNSNYVEDGVMFWKVEEMTLE